MPKTVNNRQRIITKRDFMADLKKACKPKMTMTPKWVNKFMRTPSHYEGNPAKMPV